MYFDLTLLKTSIEAMMCPKHGRHPKAVLNKQGTISITACCDEFRDTCNRVKEDGYITIAERKADNRLMGYYDY